MMFKQRIKNILGEFVYFFYKQKIFKNKIKVYSIDKTIDELLNTAKYSTDIKETIKKMLDSKLDNLTFKYK